jgi:hypothetical protein
MTDGSVTMDLRRLTRDELVLGERLPGHVRDRSGRVLIRRGQVLLPKHMDLLSEREAWKVFAGPDWPTLPRPPRRTRTPSPEELMHALKRQRFTRKDKNRVRRHTRHRCRMQAKLMVAENKNTGSQRVQMEITTCDVGLGGLSFICDRFLYTGSVVYLRLQALANQPVMKGVIRNCTYIDGREHRVGVEFVELGPGEEIPRF